MIKAIAYCSLSALLVSAAQANQDDAELYLSLTEQEKPHNLHQLQAFNNVFENLNGDRLERRVKDAYAEDLYFNDTLVTLYSRKNLIEYLKATEEKANQVKTTILDTAQSGDDFYIRWLLEMEFDALGKTIVSRSVGMSHLRLDENGKIAVHQDFWDSATGLYAHLPLVGGLISWIKNRLSAYPGSAEDSASPVSEK